MTAAILSLSPPPAAPRTNDDTPPPRSRKSRKDDIVVDDAKVTLLEEAGITKELLVSVLKALAPHLKGESPKRRNSTAHPARDLSNLLDLDLAKINRAESETTRSELVRIHHVLALCTTLPPHNLEIETHMQLFSRILSRSAAQ